MMKNIAFEKIPSVSKILHDMGPQKSIHSSYLKFIIGIEIEKIRIQIKKGLNKKTAKQILEDIILRVKKRSSHSLLNIINGTGIVLHTGLGRAPFPGKTLKKISDRLNGYVNLEYNLSSGERGDRQVHIREHISAICDSESALMVNNNAAAVMLSINEIANNGEVIVSRGQLVEIGGSFRIPDIIYKSGATLKEVGTTNRTHLEDYSDAITAKTKLLLWVHTSNYVIKGFTKSVPLINLIALGQKHKIPVMVDWGSGSLLDMNTLKIANEKPINKIIKMRPDLVTFSGDKLIGGPQSGIILGKEDIIKSLQKNILYRVLRCDKITIGLMEEILRTYISSSFTKNNLALKMLTTSRKVLKSRGLKILSLLSMEKIRKYNIQLCESQVQAGSGSLPEDKIESMSLIFSSKEIKVDELSKKFRQGATPVVGYISDNKYHIDLKAVLSNQLNQLVKAIKEL